MAKRRRVWVNFYEDGSDDGCAFETKADARENAPTGYVMTQVAFVERLPGDVVLSREEWAQALYILTEAAKGPDPLAMRAGLLAVFALLRGRR